MTVHPVPAHATVQAVIDRQAVQQRAAMANGWNVNATDRHYVAQHVAPDRLTLVRADRKVRGKAARKAEKRARRRP